MAGLRLDSKVPITNVFHSTECASGWTEKYAPLHVYNLIVTTLKVNHEPREMHTSVGLGAFETRLYRVHTA